MVTGGRGLFIREIGPEVETMEVEFNIMAGSEFAEVWSQGCKGKTSAEDRPFRTILKKI